MYGFLEYFFLGFCLLDRIIGHSMGHPLWLLDPAKDPSFGEQRTSQFLASQLQKACSNVALWP